MNVSSLLSLLPKRHGEHLEGSPPKERQNNLRFNVCQGGWTCAARAAPKPLVQRADTPFEFERGVSARHESSKREGRAAPTASPLFGCIAARGTKPTADSLRLAAADCSPVDVMFLRPSSRLGARLFESSEVFGDLTAEGSEQATRFCDAFFQFLRRRKRLCCWGDH